jgi:hypothetical protein
MVGMLFAGCVPFTSGDAKVKIEHTESGLSGAVKQTVTEQKTLMKAKVAGSIYEGGEIVSVFGTCLNATDEGFPNSYGMLSAWYPNGTLFFQNVSMTEMQTGYFVYQGPMSPVGGTYLTEFTCYINGTDVSARAFGEWQNPEWVRRINSTEALANQTLNQVNNLSNLTGQWFNITWDKLDSINASVNYSFTNITNQLTYVAMVANASVDRNDSYLAQLMLLLINGSQVPVTYALNVSVSADDPVFKGMWNVRVNVTNEYNVRVGGPIISCFINTTNAPPTVMAQMTDRQDNNVPYFTYVEKVNIRGEDAFNWSVGCVYN